VRFGIVPVLTRLDAIPMHGIWIFDDSVIIETNDSEIVTEDPTTWRSTTASWTVVAAAAEGARAREILMTAGQRWATLAGRSVDPASRSRV